MTAQVTEVLHYKGERLSMRTEPLSDYFSQMGPSPDFQRSSSACWRCYVGKWEILLDRLYFVGVSATYTDCTSVTLESLFPGFTDRVCTLVRQVTIEEVERTNLIQDPMEAVPNIPFGHCNARWVVFKDSLQENETLWEFESTRFELKGVQAMWGYAVKRDGRVDRFMTSGWKLKIGMFE